MRAWLAALLLCSIVLAGCASGGDTDDDDDGVTDKQERALGTDPKDADSDDDGLDDGAEQALGTNATSADTDGDTVPDGAEVVEGDDPLLPGVRATFSVHDVGESGAEPSLGVDAAGAVYFQAMEKTMKSTDQGASWANVNPLFALPTTLDPYLWLDPVTDRVFANQLYVACSYLTFTDDGGANWLANPAACGTPANDHQKMTTGPYVPGSPLDVAATANKLVYPNVVYYGVNGLVDSRVAMSIDGGVTFPFVAESFPAVALPGNDQTQCGGGLHGNIVAGPDGTVYIPSRSGCAKDERTLGGPVVGVSEDNGLTWRATLVADDVGTPYDDKNSDIGVDAENNVYLAFPGGDNRLWLATSMDHGLSWSPAVVMTPGLGTTTMPALVAGSPGRIAVAYYGIEDPTTSNWTDEPTVLAVPDHVPDHARWSLFVTLSLDALAPTPTFHTFKVTGDDPVQVGGISTNSGDSDGAERNLLDFIDAVIDRDGRVHVAFADGCTSETCKGPDGEPGDSRDDLGTYARLVTGPSLYADRPDLA